MLPPNPMLLHAFDMLDAGQEQEALALFLELAERDDPGALATLAGLNWQGGLIPRNFATGRELYQRASDAGDVGSAIYTTNRLENGYVGERDLALQRRACAAKPRTIRHAPK
jgi:TPR repeat protein